MEEDSTATMVDDLNVSQAGAAPPMEALLEPTASPGPAPADSVTPTSANAEPASSVPPAEPSNAPASDGLLDNIAASVAAPSVAKSVRRIKGGAELGRRNRTDLDYWNPEVSSATRPTSPYRAAESRSLNTAIYKSRL